MLDRRHAVNTKAAAVETTDSAQCLSVPSRVAAIIGVVLAGAASAQEPPLPSTYLFPDSNAAMAVAFLDPNMSNETKRELSLLLEARR
jgi:hypothetical protein